MTLEIEGLPSHVGWAVATTPVVPTDLHPEEQAILRSSAGEKRRTHFSLGRWAAHEALRKLDLDVDVIGCGPSGEPLWPGGVRGSITHGADLAIALVSTDEMTYGVGVDVERGRPTPELDAHVPRAEERIWLDRNDPEARERELLALFSAKEAIFKAFYPRVQRFFGFEAALLRRDPEGFTARFAEPLDEEYPAERTFHVASRWHGDLVVSWLVLPKDRAQHCESLTRSIDDAGRDHACARALCNADSLASRE